MKHHNMIGIGLVGVVIVGAVVWAHYRQPSKSNTPASSNTQQTNNQTTQNTTPEFNKTLYSISEADSLWVIINKQRVLADGYKPVDLVVPNVPLRLSADSEQMHVRATMAKAMENLFKGASDNNLHLMLASGFRSQAYQTSLYNGYVAKDGQSAADRSSARPGHSEHQTGLSFDIEPADKRCELDQCFGTTPEGVWLSAHAHEYGFIIRYGKDQEQLTGYEYEPWHLRYVGNALAQELYTKHQTMEQFFGLPPALNY